MTKPLTLGDLETTIREIVRYEFGSTLLNGPSIARAILTTIKEAGWKIVPVEATDGMIIRGIVERHGSDVPEAWSLATKNIWQAMLSAAPQIEGE